MTIAQIRAIVAEADPHAGHYRSASKTQNYTAWHEFRREPIYGDDGVAEDGWAFQVDRFTTLEEDPMVDRIWETLQRHRLHVTHIVLPDPDTRYIHHAFQCQGV